MSCVVPIIHLSKTNVYLAELFHGPTGSFKDLALQLLPRYIKSKFVWCRTLQSSTVCRLVSLLLLPHEKHVYLGGELYIISCAHEMMYLLPTYVHLQYEL